MKFALATIIVTLVVASANSVSELRSKLPREAVLAPAELSMRRTLTKGERLVSLMSTKYIVQKMY